MALNFGFLGNLSRALPGYIEGQRQAVQDNWQDLKNWNEVYSGQLGNMYAAETFQDRLSRERDLAALSQMGVEQGRANLDLLRRRLPGEQWASDFMSAWRPQSELDKLHYAYMMMNNPFIQQYGSMGMGMYNPFM